MMRYHFPHSWGRWQLDHFSATTSYAKQWRACAKCGKIKVRWVSQW